MGNVASNKEAESNKSSTKKSETSWTSKFKFRGRSSEESAARKERSKKRHKAVEELLSTEETYVELLKLCIQHWMIPLNPIISSPDLSSIYTPRAPEMSPGPQLGQSVHDAAQLTNNQKNEGTPGPPQLITETVTSSTKSENSTRFFRRGGTSRDNSNDSKIFVKLGKNNNNNNNNNNKDNNKDNKDNKDEKEQKDSRVTSPKSLLLSPSSGNSINSDVIASTFVSLDDEKQLLEASEMNNFENRTKILNVKDWKLIFCDLINIYGLNSSFLDSISSVVNSKKWINKPQISDPFETFTPLFAMYSNYMNNYSKKIDCVTNNIQNNQQFVEYSQLARKYSKNQLLSSLLVLPIQRLPRYKLLLSEILKNTEKNHKSHKSIQKALNDLETMTTLLNEKIREYEARIRVNELSQRFNKSIRSHGSKNSLRISNVTNNNNDTNTTATNTAALTSGSMGRIGIIKKGNSGNNTPTTPTTPGTPGTPGIIKSGWSLIKPHRTFVKEGFLTKVDRTGKTTEYTFLLFNDCLIYATHTKKSDSNCALKLNQEIPFDAAFSLKSIKDNKMNKFDNTAFEIHSSVKSFIVFAETEKEKEEWISTISSSLANWHNENLEIILSEMKENKEDVFKSQPILIPDDYSDICMVNGCENKFTKLKRRHHCRMCGYLICGKCSNKVKSGKNTMKPVCNPCHDKWVKTYGISED